MEYLTNKATVSGLVWSDPTYSHRVLDEDFYRFFIYSQRLSENADRIPVTVSARLFAAHKIESGTPLLVSGQFRSYNAVDQDGISHLILTLFAKELVPDPPPVENPNYIYLNGFICRKPIFRRTPFGREITDILLAVNRSFNKSDYIPIIFWGKNARSGSLLNVGDRIELHGRIQSREYRKKNEDGSFFTQTAYEVSVSEFKCLPQ